MKDIYVFDVCLYLVLRISPLAMKKCNKFERVYENSTRSSLVGIILSGSLYTVARTSCDECHHNLQVMKKKPSFLF